jgi:hypothetical protein
MALSEAVLSISKIEIPREFFDHVVNPDVDDFIGGPTDLRRAYHACTSLLSLRDWIVKSYHNRDWSWQKQLQGKITSVRKMQEALNTIDKSFRITTDIANASKHMILDPAKRQTELYGAANVEIRTVTTAAGGSALGGVTLNSAMLNQAPIVVTSDRIRVQIGTVYFDVLTCVVKTRAIWDSLIRENGW